MPVPTSISPNPNSGVISLSDKVYLEEDFVNYGELKDIFALHNFAEVTNSGEDALIDVSGVMLVNREDGFIKNYSGATIVNNKRMTTKDGSKIWSDKGKFVNNAGATFVNGGLFNAFGASDWAPLTNLGRLINNGELKSKDDIKNANSFENGEDGYIAISFGKFRNLGSDANYPTNGIFENNGKIDLYTEGVVMVNHANAVIDNQDEGIMSIGKLSTLINRGDFENNGLINLWGKIDNQDEGVFINYGNIVVNEGAEILGELNDRQTIRLESDLSSSLDIEGNYIKSDGNIILRPGGNTINVKGDVELAGGLKLDLDEVNLSVGEQFTFLEVGGDLSGTFYNLSEGSLVETYVDQYGEAHDLRITYKSGDGNDISLYAIKNGDDTQGTKSSETLNGGDGKQYMHGGGGDDKLIGGKGSDVLVGGDGSDLFAFQTAQDSRSGKSHRDVIIDFRRGEDKIDLSSVDDELTFIASNDFNGDSQVRFSNGLVQVSTDSDSRPELEIQLLDVDTLAATDFIF
ncbi:Poly(beta-D-mannuronate) C5 epimerase 5 [Prochlorococcus marinus str. MIT 1342]|uniref:calcium-binding protein n=1 Tax=Prochlorococcus TaxID=1218 RepID=UPI0007BBA7F8|nr:M10 family metallopeptidase C-terminal domain-containing protein [Prochlorococcus marinus]KZR80151.1 Poly(beta-D-mannuronate) C5 epimerase 5 [Prochlorococcus marinus str. MIT 1342]